jgi:hypothetical protein
MFIKVRENLEFGAMHPVLNGTQKLNQEKMSSTVFSQATDNWTRHPGSMGFSTLEHLGDILSID